MFLHTIRTHGARLVAGAFVVAAATVPFYAALTSSDAAPQVTAGPACLAWFGNKEDGNCLSYSEGNGAIVGTPNVGLGGPFGIGIYTAPLLPGTTITREFG